MHIFYQPDLPAVQHLDEEESKHCIKVLRMQLGDLIRVIDGKGTFYTAKITDAKAKKCAFEVTETAFQEEFPFKRHLVIAPTKNIDRMEWLIEKATELGVDAISFILCRHSERKVLKMDRIEKKAIAAMKQSLKARLPILNAPVSFEDFLRKRNEGVLCIAFVDFENPMAFKDSLDGRDCTVLIGPEGDFSEEEVQKALACGYIKVSLGKSRLRTETAGMAAVHLMNLAGE